MLECQIILFQFTIQVLLCICVHNLFTKGLLKSEIDVVWEECILLLNGHRSSRLRSHFSELLYLLFILLSFEEMIDSFQRQLLITIFSLVYDRIDHKRINAELAIVLLYQCT